MPTGQERAIRRRIKSVQSTKKITRAMELIAASRIVKAQQRVSAARPYSEAITEVIRHAAATGAGKDHPLLTSRDVSTVGLVAITADRGLAGAYNVSVYRAAERTLEERRREEGASGLFILSGSKGEGYFRYRGHDIAAAFGGYSEKPGYDDARAVADVVMERFEEGDIDQVELIYTRFLSAGSQKVTVSRLLPLEMESLAESKEGPQADYEFEPEPGEILDRLLPRYVEARVFAAMLDAAASEHAARQRAMKAATDNAEELIDKLAVSANKMRQAGITTEIMEIVGGAEALRQGRAGGVDLLPDTMVSRDVLPDYIDRSRVGARR